MNDLLALLAYEGVGNEKASEYDSSQQFINWPPKGPLSPIKHKPQANIDEAEQEALKDLGDSLGVLQRDLKKPGEKRERLF